VAACGVRLYNGHWIGDEMSGELLFDLLLPFIILKEGFTMRKKFFFENIGYVVGFGFFGTIVFICIWIPIVIYLNNWLGGVLDG
jgi:NhaP-type Na+/H+ or K+/H+ antiporter